MQALALLLIVASPSLTSGEDGAALLERFECNRCHDGTGLASASEKRHCVRCHQSILSGTFAANRETLAKWQQNLVSLRAVPSLAGVGRVLRRSWVESFLLAPSDQRPHLPATMPRLALTSKEATALARHLVPSEVSGPAPNSALVDSGRAIYRRLRCGECHVFSGSGEAFLGKTAPEMNAVSLAPDLRFVRARFQPAALADWLRAPPELRPDTLMPTLGLSAADASALAAFVWHAPLAPAEEPREQGAPIRLERRVGYAEVEARVFRKVCWHCHSSPDYNWGDGGPGNTGGFGFAARGLDLSSYESVAAGVIAESGQRQSVFAPGPDGTPRLLAVLLARQAEERGEHKSALRGMPLGLPSLSSEQIALVEAWIRQGRPR